MSHRNPFPALVVFFSAVTIGLGANRLPDYGKLSLSFEANQGQANGQVKFLAHGQGYTLLLSEGEAAIASPESAELRMKFVRSNPAAVISGVDEQAGKVNYYAGTDPKKWQEGVPTYGKVRYKNIYSGIDLVYYGNQRQLEYDFVVGPGADPRRIGFEVRGATKISRSDDGDLVLGIGEREVRWHKPVVYQEDGGVRREVAGRYVIKGRRVGFEVAQYDRARALFIDPTLVYSTYFSPGGGGIAVDGSGNAYIAETVGQVFVAKLNPLGTALIYTTYLGSGTSGGGILPSGYNSGGGIAVDSSGNAYVTGSTTTDTFPTLNPFQASNPDPGYSVAFITKLSPSGALVYSTYFGFAAVYGHAIAVDSSGAAYITGQAEQGTLPLVGGGFGGAGFASGFVSELNPAGSALVYSFSIGGGLESSGEAIAVDSSGAAYVTGQALSQHNDDGIYAFVAKVNPAGGPEYSLFLADGWGSGTLTETNATTIGYGIAVDSSGAAYVTGTTTATDFPTVNPLQPAIGGTVPTAFLTKINPTGSALVYSTYLAGSGGYVIAVDGSGDAYVTGPTSSSNFPTLNPLPGFTSGGFLAALNPSGSALLFSTYLDGVAGGIAADGSGDIYVTGTTSSSGFPTTANVYEPSGSVGDAFVMKIAPGGTGTTLQLSETKWTFGPWVVGSATSEATVYVTNIGTAAADFSSVPLVSSLAGLKFDTTCGPTLAAGAFCVVQFNYTASALGTVTGTLTLQSNAANGPNVIQIVATGSGVLPQFYSWNFSSIPVGTTRATGEIYLKSETPAAMNLSSTVVTLGGADPGDFSLTNHCSAAVAPYQSCELLFAFTPKVAGYRQAAIVITSPQIQNGQLIIPITGWANPAP